MKYTLIALLTLLLAACAASAKASSSTDASTHGEEPSFSGEPATAPADTTGSELPGAEQDDQSTSSDDPILPAVATRVTGKVTDASGNPIAEAGVAVTKSSTGVPEILALTNEKGEYVWNLPPGEFTLTVYKDGYKELSKDVTLKEGETVQLDFQLEKQP